MIRRNNTNHKNQSLPISPLESVNQPASRKNRRGQNVTEYLVLVAGILVVMILATNSRGIFTQGTNRAIGLIMNSAESVATEQCLGPVDDIAGGWGSWTAWTPCTSCVESRSHVCDNPAPRCNGADCLLGDGSRGLIETQTRACASGTWMTGTCGACTGSCGSTTGTCPQAVSCSGGCCDTATQPPATLPCVKTPYPDSWLGLNDWTCGANCGQEVATQTVTCNGSCCDLSAQPPVRRACTNGCCDQVLDIGSGLTGTFAAAANGQPSTVSCPSGYGGTPTRTCSATASSSCTGDSGYTPPSSCYNISWGPLSSGCVPGSCTAWTTNVNGVSVTFPSSPHGSSPTLNCSTFDSTSSGTVSADCNATNWVNLTGTCCRPACPTGSCGMQDDGCGNMIDCGFCACSAPEGGMIAHGTSRTYYQTDTVPCGSTCAPLAQTRTCTDGNLSGSHTNPGCSVDACAACPVPEGGTIAHGTSRTYYQSSSVACGGNCASIDEVRTCTNGTLSGSYTNPACSVQPCDCPAPEGGTIPNGASRTYYQSSSVPCGSTCAPLAQTRTCTNGTLSGTYVNPACSVQACLSCPAPEGGTIPHGTSRTYYQSTSVPCGSSCSTIAQTRTCNNGILSGTYTNPACTVASCCGNGVVNTGEQCDTNPGACSYANGGFLYPSTRTCSGSCAWNACAPVPMFCGDGIVNGNETCPACVDAGRCWVQVGSVPSCTFTGSRPTPCTLGTTACIYTPPSGSCYSSCSGTWRYYECRGY